MEHVEAYAWIPAAIAATAGMVSQIKASRDRRREYREMQQYNAPKAQMARFQEAGLSPYLIYGQGSSGNVSEPQPVQEYGIEEGIGNFAGMINSQNIQQEMKFRKKAFPWDLSMKRNEALATQYSSDITAEKAQQERYKSLRMGLDLAADYGDAAASGEFHPGVVAGGFRTKMNELKRSLTEAQVEQLRTAVQGLKLKNIVDAVKARYADEWGMVGGDWTQGLGLLKSMTTGFLRSRKSRGKVTHELENVMKTGRRTIRRRTYER